LIKNEDLWNFLDEYVFYANFDNIDIENCNRVELFKNIREKWIEKKIEEIGIIKNKKYLLDFIKEKDYNDSKIQALLNKLKFEGNDNEIDLKNFLLTLRKVMIDNDNYNIFLLMEKDEIKSFQDLYDNFFYYSTLIFVIDKKYNINENSSFINIGKKLLAIGWSLNEIEELLDKKIDYKKISYEEFNEIIDTIYNNKILYSKVNNNQENLIDIFSNYSPKEWEYQIKKLLVGDLKPYDFGSLLEEILKLNSKAFSKNEVEDFGNIIIKIKQKKYHYLSETNILIKDIENNNIRTYISSSYFKNFIEKSKTSRESYIEFLIEILAIVNRALKIFTQGPERLNEGYELRDVQLFAIIIILLSPKKKGIFAQIKTGQGKSIIIAVLAIIKALYLKYVDILTSNIELAYRDAKELKPFYDIFNLTVSCTTEENPYISNIIYSDTLKLEGDILREKFLEEGKRIKNTSRGFKCLIIDEVDSVCVDRLNESTLLSFYPKGLSFIEIIYSYISYMYNAFLYGYLNGYYGEIDQINYQFLREKFSNGLDSFLKNNSIRIPKHLKSFVNNQVKKYTCSIVNALNFKEKDVQYKVMDNKIKIVDYLNTGIIYNNMEWNDALHQFLEIKHGVPLTIESITTTFLCHYNYIMLYQNKPENNYETHIIGVTGTIGSEATKKLLRKLFDINIVIIPPFCPSKFIRLTSKYGYDTLEEWRNAIVDETIENTSKNRPVLIITNSGKELSNLYNLLKKKWNKNYIYTYEVNGKDELKKAFSTGEILVGTNLAGRGTDLKLIENVEHFGGLHVIITFLPINLRVEEQGFGRTARKGLSGTGRLIIKEYKAKKTLENERESQEKEILKFIEDNVIQNLILKEELFNKICEMVQNLRKKGYDEYVIDDLQNQWGLFYKCNLEDDWLEYTQEKRNQIINLYNKFEKQLLNNIENKIFTNPLNCIETDEYDNSLKYDEITCFYFYEYRAYYNREYIKKIEDLNKFIEITKNCIIPELFSIGAISNISHKRNFLFMYN